MKTKQAGFSAVEGLLVVIIVVLLVVIGWFVLNKQNDAAKTATTTKPTPSTSQTKPDTAPSGSCQTSGNSQIRWTRAESSQKSFNLCVPGGWTLVSDTESETFHVYPPFVLVKDTDAVIRSEITGGKDGTRDMVQVFKAAERYQGWTNEDAAKTTFTLSDGTEGTRYYTKHTDVGEGIGPVEGEEDYEYLFEKGGKHVHAVYTIHPGTTKHLDTVESVLKTLTIN